MTTSSFTYIYPDGDLRKEVINLVPASTLASLYDEGQLQVRYVVEDGEIVGYEA